MFGPYAFLLSTLCVLVLFCALSFHLIDSVNPHYCPINIWKNNHFKILKMMLRDYQLFFISLMHVLSYLKFNLDPLKETRHSHWTST